MKRLALACALSIGCNAGAPTTTLVPLPPDGNGVEAESTIPIGGGPFTDLAINPDGLFMCVGNSQFGFYGLDGKCLPDGAPAVVPRDCFAARHFFYSLRDQLRVYDEAWHMLGAATFADANAGAIPTLRIAASADGLTMAAAGWVGDGGNLDPGTTYLTQVNVGAVDGAAQGRLLARFAGAPNDFAVSPDGKTAVVPIDGKLVAIDVSSTAQRPLASLPETPWSLVWPSGGNLLAGGAGGVYDVDAIADRAVKLADAGGDGVYLGAIARTLDGAHLVAHAQNSYSGDGRLRVLDVGAGAWRTVARHRGEDFLAIALTPDGAKLYALTETTLYVYDAAALVSARAISDGN